MTAIGPAPTLCLAARRRPTHVACDYLLKDAEVYISNVSKLNTVSSDFGFS